MQYVATGQQPTCRAPKEPQELRYRSENASTKYRVIVVSDGCDLAGAIPNCKAVMAELAAKGVKGTGHRIDASAGGTIALKP